MSRILLLVLCILGARAADHLRYGRASSEDVVLQGKGFALGYREADEQAAWVAYCLTSAELDKAKIKRSDDFRRDARVTSGSATPEDYKGSGFDRGHLAPAADMAWSELAMSESFLMSNMSPQEPAFNRGIWSRLEEQVREFARQHGKLWVVTGPVLGKPREHIGANQVSVPRQYYKVLFAPKPKPAMLAFLLPNDGSSEALARFVVSVDSVEAVTGMDFFAKLADRQERALELGHSTTGWTFAPSESRR